MKKDNCIKEENIMEKLVQIYLSYTTAYLDWLSMQLCLDSTMYTKEDCEAIQIAKRLKRKE